MGLEPTICSTYKWIMHLSNVPLTKTICHCNSSHEISTAISYSLDHRAQRALVCDVYALMPPVTKQHDVVLAKGQ